MVKLTDPGIYGTIALVIYQGNYQYYINGNDSWIIDSFGPDFPNQEWFDYIAPGKLDLSALPPLEIIAANWFYPSLLIDVDSKLLVNNYPEQDLEERVPDGWKGKYEKDWLKFWQLIPVNLHYWREIGR